MAGKINSYIEDLRHTVLVAQLNYDIWWVYRGKGTRERYLDIMNDYVSFFSTSIHAHFVAMLTALYRLYETRPDTKNIPQLLKLLKKEGLLGESYLSELETHCSVKIKPLWIKVSSLRNEAFGHRSDLLSVEALFKKTDIKPNDLKQLTELSKELLNKITQERSRDTYAFNLTSRDDTVGVLETLIRAKE